MPVIIGLVCVVENVDNICGLPIFPQPPITCLSCWMTILVYQNLRPGTRVASWFTITQFAFSVGFCEWSAQIGGIASPTRLGVGIGYFRSFYVFHLLVSGLGLIYEIGGMSF